MYSYRLFHVSNTSLLTTGINIGYFVMHLLRWTLNCQDYQRIIYIYLVSFDEHQQPDTPIHLSHIIFTFLVTMMREVKILFTDLKTTG